MKPATAEIGRASRNHRYRRAEWPRTRESAVTPIHRGEEALVEVIKRIPGEKRVVLEESQMADWVTRVLRPHVREIIRSQPQHNRLISRAENQPRLIGVDALHLAGPSGI